MITVYTSLVTNQGPEQTIFIQSGPKFILKKNGGEKNEEFEGGIYSLDGETSEEVFNKIVTNAAAFLAAVELGAKISEGSNFEDRIDSLRKSLK